jgi:mannose-6-phosphate isomerase-like protein (cupin superfamily)
MRRRPGLAFHVLRPGKRQAFAHRHADAEAISVVLAGAGRVCLDDEIVEIGPHDAIRIAPAVTRRFEADALGLELLVFGPHHPGDGELDHAFWQE